ncbi:MAG: protease modulator HflC, partial [Deferribacterales bacterium]|nr:protease modulator HflC [Deferribacterales bacterium]
AMRVCALCFYSVDVTEQAIVTRLGKPVRTVSEPGLHFKLPFIENATFFSKMLLDYDTSPSEILTKDKKTLVIDNYCRWYIDDPLKFFLTVKNEVGAFPRIEDIVYSEMRVELARHDLIDVINQNRTEIMENVKMQAKEKAKEYGIVIQDIRVKRADLPAENEKAVYARMSTERQRIAKQYRSEGMEEAQKIKARTDKERAVIMAEAYRKVETTKGEADAKVIKIYADTYRKDPAFFEFYKSLDAYEKIIKEDTDLYLTTDSSLFRLLNSAGK